MRRSSLVLLAFPLFSLTAQAGGVLELLPDNPGPYLGGESVSVDVWLHNQDAVGHYLRLVQLDVSLSTPTVYAGGWFHVAGTVQAGSVAKWDGARNRWLALGTGLDVAPPFPQPVIGHAIELFDDGAGSDLYVGGRFITAGGVTTNHIARWDGTVWSSFGSGMDLLVRAFAVFDDGAGSALYAGGSFTDADGTPANRVARWDGVSWSPLAGGTNNTVTVMTVFDDGTGPALYGGGFFTSAGGAAANYIARWDGAAWSALDTGTNGTVFALTVFDDGTGSALYAGGEFTTAGATGANYIARWDGTSWSSVGDGMDERVFALAVWDDGTGQAIYAGGKFTMAGNNPANRIAKWDGTSWSPLGSGADDIVYTIDGTEQPPALFAGGKFTMAGGVTANHIAAWDGTAWFELGGGTDDWVRTITAIGDNDGTSPLLALDTAFDFDFSTLTNAGDTYLQLPDLPIMNFAYLGLGPVEGTILYLPPGDALHIGSLGVVLPTQAGIYTLDMANPGSVSGGAQVRFGFGAGVDEPSTVWAATAGDLTGGTYSFEVLSQPPENIPAFSVRGIAIMPLLLLAAGTVAYTRSRLPGTRA